MTQTSLTTANSSLDIEAHSTSAGDGRTQFVQVDTPEVLEHIAQLEHKKELYQKDLDAIGTNPFIPILLLSGIVLLTVEAIFAEFVYLSTYYGTIYLSTGPIIFLMPEWLVNIGPLGRVALLWVVTVALLGFPYYFRIKAPANNLRKKIVKIEEKVYLLRTETTPGRRRYLQNELRKLPAMVARVFLDNPERSKLANRWWQQADDILERLEEYERLVNMGMAMAFANAKAEAAYKLRLQVEIEQRVYVRGRLPDMGEAEILISSINELILREESELRQQNYWRFAAIAIMLFYIVVVGVAIVRTSLGGPNTAGAVVPLFGIPFSVVMWGAAGSLAAILYRFYTERKRIRFDLEVRWLIARPIIGIVMSAVSYLALKLGILILNQAPPTPAANAADLYVYWAIAFLAGFSDKFYLRIIDLLVGKTVGEKSDPVPPPAEPPPPEPAEPTPAEDGEATAAVQEIVENPIASPKPPKQIGKLQKKR
jgi:hypothetical protein